MDSLVVLSIGFLVLIVVVGVGSLIWRINMMVNHPEKYRQFREFEKEFEDSMRNNMRRQGEVVGKVVKGVAKGFWKK